MEVVFRLNQSMGLYMPLLDLMFNVCVCVRGTGEEEVA